MTRYEFYWTILPSRKREWNEKLTIDGLDFEISGDRIVVRAESVNTSEDEFRARANVSLARLVRAMEYHEGQRLTPELSRITRLPRPGLEDVGLAPADGMEICDDIGITMYGYVKLDAVLVKNSGQIKFQDILQDFARLLPGGPLERMFDLMSEFRSDSEKRLGPLYDILEIVEREYGGRKEAAYALKLPVVDLGALAKITNDASIRTARHRGQAVGPLRDTTPHELAHCVQIAEGIIRAYAIQCH